MDDDPAVAVRGLAAWVSSSRAVAATCRRSSTRSTTAGSTLRSRSSSRMSSDAAGLERARRAGIETLCLTPSRLGVSGRLRSRARARAEGARRRTGVSRRLHAPRRPAAARRISKRDPEHPSVVAARVSRRRRAAAGDRSRRQGERRHRAFRRRRSSTRVRSSFSVPCRSSMTTHRRRWQPVSWSRSTGPIPKPSQPCSTAAGGSRVVVSGCVRVARAWRGSLDGASRWRPPAGS